MKPFEIQKTRIYSKTYSKNDPFPFQYLQQLHSIQRVDWIHPESKTERQSVVVNNKTIKITTKLTDLLTLEFINTFPTISLLSQCDVLSPIIIQFETKTLTISVETQVYQTLGIIGKFDKINERYYITIPYTSIEKFNSKLQLLPVVNLLVWSNEEDVLIEYLNQHSIKYISIPHEVTTKNYFKSPFSFDLNNVYECIGGFCCDIKSLTDKSCGEAFVVERLSLLQSGISLTHHISQGTIQCKWDLDYLKQTSNEWDIIVCYGCNWALTIWDSSIHTLCCDNNNFIVTMINKGETIELYVEHPMSDHVKLK
ncbi:Uncharacterized protein QTN25_004521 [Entamoeba marina]